MLRSGRRVVLRSCLQQTPLPVVPEGKPKLTWIFPEKHHPGQVLDSLPPKDFFLSCFYLIPDFIPGSMRFSFFFFPSIPFQRYRKMLWIDTQVVSLFSPSLHPAGDGLHIFAKATAMQIRQQDATAVCIAGADTNRNKWLHRCRRSEQRNVSV